MATNDVLDAIHHSTTKGKLAKAFAAREKMTHTGGHGMKERGDADVGTFQNPAGNGGEDCEM